MAVVVAASVGTGAVADTAQAAAIEVSIFHMKLDDHTKALTR